MPPLKIFYLIGTLEVGGTERQLVRMVTRLDRERFTPVVCGLSAGGALEPELRAQGIPVYVVGFRGIGVVRRLPRMLRELGRLVRIIRAESPDILHGFLFWAYVLGAFTGRAARVPIIIASRRSLSLFKGGRLHYLALEWLANRLTDFFIANSEAVRQDAITTERIDPGRIMVIHNGLDLEAFAGGDRKAARRRLGISPDSPAVAVVANLIAYKGHTYFIDAWRQVVDRYPDAVALLAGDGQCRGALEAQARERGLESSIRFLGTFRDVPTLLAAADLVVHPSLQEGFSNAIVEAMAAGKPVVATTIGGNPEAVVDGVTGLLVPSENRAALAAGMLRLLADPALAARMGAAGRSKAVDAFDLNAMVRHYESLYERLAEGKRLRTPKRQPEVAL